MKNSDWDQSKHLWEKFKFSIGGSFQSTSEMFFYFYASIEERYSSYPKIKPKQ